MKIIDLKRAREGRKDSKDSTLALGFEVQKLKSCTFALEFVECVSLAKAR